MIVVPADAERHHLERLLNETMTVHLFTNRHAPRDRDVAGDYVELRDHGYRPMDIVPHEWMVTPGDDKQPALAVAPARRWVFRQGPLDPRSQRPRRTLVHGYFVTWPGGRLSWLERFEAEDGEPTPQGIQWDDDEIRVIPKFTLRDLRECAPEAG